VNVRGVSPVAYPVHTLVRLADGRLPEKQNEMLVGCTAHVRLGLPADAFALGRTLRVYNTDWTVCGHFTASSTLFESELWVDADELQRVLNRRTYTFVVVRMESPEKVREALPYFRQSGAFEKFFKGWPEPAYYHDYFGSLSWMYWLTLVMAAAVTLAGALIGINTMYTAILNRIREMATQRVMGFARWDILCGLLLESLLVALVAGALGVALAYTVNDVQFKLSQGVFRIAVDPLVMGGGLVQAALIGLVGALIPAYKGLKPTIVEALRYGRDV